MNKIFEWAKNNKLVIIISVVAIYLFINNLNFNINPMKTVSYESMGIGGAGLDSPTVGFRAPTPVYQESAPQLDVTDRKVITESTMSLLVKNVRQALEDIQTQTESLGGYMVNTNLSSPEESDTGNITVRVPSNNLQAMLSFLREIPVRVVSENIMGRDVTDQYVDIEARLETLNKTKAIYEGLLDQATEFDDILRAQQMILQVQDQIDRNKGRLQYLDATSKAPKITVYLATDELELPFTPSKPWRPSVVFKYATRSLITTLRDVGSAAIWIGVYSVIWVPVLIVILLIRKRLLKIKEQEPQK